MDSMESEDIVNAALGRVASSQTSTPTPGEWSAQMVGWWKWAIQADDYNHVAMVENGLDGEREHVKANALVMAAAPQMLTALKAADAHLIGLALKNAQARGFDVNWQKAEVMFGVSDLHAAIRQAIQVAEVGR